MDFLALKSRYALLSRDFLTWLYHRVDQTAGQIPEVAPAELFFDDALALVGEGDRPAATTFKGDPDSMRAELIAALRGGKKIARAKLHVVRSEGDWSLVLDTDSWTVRSLRLPSGASAGGDAEAVLLERMALLEEAEATLEKLFNAYLGMRVDPKAYTAWSRDLAGWVEAG